MALTSSELVSPFFLGGLCFLEPGRSLQVINMSSDSDCLLGAVSVMPWWLGILRRVFWSQGALAPLGRHSPWGISSDVTSVFPLTSESVVRLPHARVVRVSQTRRSLYTPPTTTFKQLWATRNLSPTLPARKT